MPARTRHPVARLAAAPAVLLAACLALVAQPPEPAKKAGPAPRLFGTPVPRPDPADPDRVLVSSQELQKLHDQIEQLRRQLAARRPAAPSGCAVAARVEKRGETLTAAVHVTYSFRTTAANAPVALGGKRAFPVSATLDGKKLPILDTAEDGFAATVETPGEHTLVVEYEAAVAARGAKTEIGFEFGLPRAAITTLTLEPPAGVARVNLTTRTLDPAQPTRPPPAVRSSVEVKQLAKRPGSEAGPALGPVESLEVTWEPPAAGPTEQVQTADLDVTTTLTDRAAETRATIRPRGTAREWLVAAPVTAEVTAAPAREPGADAAPALTATVSTPPDAAKPVWKVELPAGSPAADWVIAVRIRQERAKPADPVAVGPLAVLGVARQTGRLHVAAAGSVRFEFQHGPELRRGEPPAAVDTGTTDALFRLETGPTGRAYPGPLATVRAHPVPGALWVKPVYALQLTEAGWQVEGRIQVTPLRAEVDAVTVEVPANWRSFQVGPPSVVAGVEEPDGPKRVAVVRLVQGRRQPFTLSFAAVSPVEPGAGEASVLLPRFPPVPLKDGRLDVTETETTVTAAVDPGNEVRGSGREWDRDQPAAWGRPLAPVPGPDGRPPKAATAVTGRFEHGLARVDLAWHEHKPELTADVRAEVTVGWRQVRVVQVVKLQPARAGRFRGPTTGVEGLRAEPPLHQVAPGEWRAVNEAEAVPAFRIEYAVPIARDGPGPWRVPVPLLWPAAATRTETVVRVWADADAAQVAAVRSDGWRDLPAEAAADRAALPLATLAGTGTLPLALDLRDPGDAGRVSVWVGAGLIRVKADADRPAEYRARFRLRRWLADAVEVRVPGRDVRVTVDGVAVPAAGSNADEDGVTVRVPLPPPRPEPIDVEVSYRRGPLAARGDSLEPPRLARAAFDGPVRWQVTLPNGTAPLLTDGGAAEQRWQFRSGMLVPVPAASEAGLDRWFDADRDPAGGAAGEPGELVVRQASPGPVRVAAVPRAGLVLACSLVVFVLGLVASRLPGAVAGPAVAVLGGAAAVAAVLYPQPAAQAAAAAQPGLAAVVAVLGGLAAVRWYYRRRVTHLPGFARLRTPAGPSSVTARPSARPQPAAAGSTGSAAGPQPVETN